jgi:hypothetical protein
VLKNRRKITAARKTEPTTGSTIRESRARRITAAVVENELHMNLSHHHVGDREPFDE